MICSAPADAQTHGNSNTFVWYEGKVRHETHLLPGLVAEFGHRSSSGPQNSQNGLHKLSGSSLVKQASGARIYRLTAAAQQKLSQSSVNLNRSPVFSTSPEGGPLRALPGGILVTFSESRDEIWIREWADQNNLDLDKVLPVTTASIALIRTAPGLASLEIANRVRTLPGVESAQPNWWTEKWRGTIEGPKVAPQKVRQAVESREELSRRFSQ